MKKRLLKEQVERGLRREFFAREAVARAHARADATERAAREAREALGQLVAESRAAQARADAAVKQLLSEQAARARLEGVVGLDVSAMKRDLDVLKREREQIADALSQALKAARPNELPPLKEEGLFLVAEAVVRALNAREPLADPLTTPLDVSKERDEARAVLRALVAALPECDECYRPSLKHPLAHGPSVCAEHGYQETIGGTMDWVDMRREWASAIAEAERVLR